jgi:hypothetical protein
MPGGKAKDVKLWVQKTRAGGGISVYAHTSTFSSKSSFYSHTFSHPNRLCVFFLSRDASYRKEKGTEEKGDLFTTGSWYYWVVVDGLIIIQLLNNSKIIDGWMLLTGSE